MPFEGDYIDYIMVDIPVKDIIKVNKVIGVEAALLKFNTGLYTNVWGCPFFVIDPKLQDGEKILFLLIFIIGS